MNSACATDRTRRVSRAAVVACATLLLAACASVRPLPPEVNLTNLEVTDLTLSHANLMADLKIFNPNDVSVTVEQVEYALLLNDVKISAGKSLEKVRIDAGEYGETTLRLSSAYLDLWRILNQMQKGENVRFNLKGKIKVGGFGILRKAFHFSRKGNIPLTRPQP